MLGKWSLIGGGVALMLLGAVTACFKAGDPVLTDAEYMALAITRAQTDFRIEKSYQRPAVVYGIVAGDFTGGLVPGPNGYHRRVLALEPARLGDDIDQFVSLECQELALAGEFAQFGKLISYKISRSHEREIGDYLDRSYIVTAVSEIVGGLTDDCTNTVAAYFGNGLGMFTPVGGVATIAKFMKGDDVSKIDMLFAVSGLTPVKLLRKLGVLGKAAEGAKSVLGTVDDIRAKAGIADTIWSYAQRQISEQSYKQRTHHPGVNVKLEDRLTPFAPPGIIADHAPAPTETDDVVSKLVNDLLPKFQRVRAAIHRDEVEVEEIINLFHEEGPDVAWVTLYHASDDSFQDLRKILDLRMHFRKMWQQSGLDADKAMPVLPFTHYTRIRSLEHLRDQGVSNPWIVLSMILAGLGGCVVLVGCFTKPKTHHPDLPYPHF